MSGDEPTLLTWCGKDVMTMTREELEKALRHSCRLLENEREYQRERSKFTVDLMRLVAHR